MMVFQLFPTFARLLTGSDDADLGEQIAANSFPPGVPPVVATPNAAALDHPEDRVSERLEEATQILLGLIKTEEVRPPIFPRSAREAYQMSLSPQVTVADLTQVLERDPGLAMRLLRQANESLVSPVSPCRSIHEAIARVGTTPLRHLLMRATSERLLVIPENQGMTERLQGRAPAVARCAQRIARRIGADASVAFTAGLLHDVGWVLAFDLLRNHPERFPDWVHTERVRTWSAIAEYSHQLLGATLATRWDLPSPVVAAVAFHHAPEQAREPEAEMAYIVAVANSLCDHLDIYPHRDRVVVPDWSSAWAIGVDPDTLRRESTGLVSSLRGADTGMAVGVWRPRLGVGESERGRGALDDGLDDIF
jgi:putative nucleotidyltransferase with HDIG domain